MDVTQLFYADTEVPPLVKSPFLPPERIYVNDRVSALLNDVEVVEWRAAIDSTRQLFARSMNLNEISMSQTFLRHRRLSRTQRI